jgi:hypothetical protein
MVVEVMVVKLMRGDGRHTDTDSDPHRNISESRARRGLLPLPHNCPSTGARTSFSAAPTPRNQLTRRVVQHPHLFHG